MDYDGVYASPSSISGGLNLTPDLLLFLNRTDEISFDGSTMGSVIMPSQKRRGVVSKP